MKQLTLLIFMLSLTLLMTSCNNIVPSNEHSVQTDEQIEPIETEQPTDTASGAMGGANLCPIHSIEFHNYTGDMIDYVGGQERFIAWHNANMEKESGIEGCPYYPNIYRFINYFDIPKNDFEALCYETANYYYFDYNVDLLYGNDFSAINQYYTSHSEREDYRERLASLGDIKYGILYHAMSSTDEKMRSFFDSHCENNTLDLINWSVADFVRETGISKSDVKALISDITTIEYPGKTVTLNCFDFDFDYLYSDDNAISYTENSKTSTIQKINEDLRFCQQSLINIPINGDISENK